MRLTKSDKDAFVQAVLNDVPQVDYDEQARKIVMDWAISVMPPEVRQTYHSHPGYFENSYVQTSHAFFGCFAPTGGRVVQLNIEAPETWKQLEALAKLSEEQGEKIRKLRSKVRGIIESCSTLKTAQERLPEFAKYLPTDRDGGKFENLPVANTVADLINAGWPKHKEAA